MTSEARESELLTGEPIALFKFTRGGVSWRYTSADSEQTHNAETYSPLAIEGSKIEQGSERRKLTYTIKLPSTAAVADNWRPYPPGSAVAVAVFLKHAGETDALAEWVGRVVAAQFSGGTLTLRSEPSTTTARRAGLHRAWQPGCPLALYSEGVGQCNLSKAANELPATLTAVNGLVLTAAEFGTAPKGLAGGFIEWTRADGLVEQRSIEAHSGSDITIDWGAEDLAVDLALSAYPGCAHNWTACEGHANTPNYGGDLWMPIKNPFSGDPVQ